MKFKSLMLLLLLFLGRVVFSLHYPLLAQESRKNYLVKRDYYLKQYQEYIAARQTYLSYQTLQTKESFTNKLREFLIARNEFLKSYLLMLLDEGQKFLLKENSAQITFWVNWLSKNSSEISSAKSLEELSLLANRLKKEYPKIEKTIFVFLARLTVVQQQILAKEIEWLVVQIKANLNTFEANSEPVSYWLNEVSGRLKIAQEKQGLALKQIEKAEIKKLGISKANWRKSKQLLIEANLQLREAVEFLDEIIDVLGQ